MRQALFRWLYRLLVPGHPRGWLDVQAVYEGGAPRQTVWVHCHGMERWGLPNLEIVGVPADLCGHAQGILYDVAGTMKSVKPIRPGESVGGRLVSRHQRPRHQATLRAIDRPGDPAHSGFVRIVDFGQSAASGFPRRLMAAHLCALAEQDQDPACRERLYRRAIALWRGDPAAAAAEGAAEPGGNENNFLAWEGLGEALCDQGHFGEGIVALEEAVARSPRWAREFSGHIRGQCGPAQPGAADPRFTFWSKVDVDEVCLRVLKRSGRRGPSSPAARGDAPYPPRKPR